MSGLGESNLDSSCVALQSPNCAGASIKGCLGLRQWQHSPETHTDPQSLRHLLDEWGACIWQSLGYQADWQVKGQRERLKVLQCDEVKERMSVNPRQTAENVGIWTNRQNYLFLSSH